MNALYVCVHDNLVTQTLWLDDFIDYLLGVVLRELSVVSRER